MPGSKGWRRGRRRIGWSLAAGLERNRGIGIKARKKAEAGAKPPAPPLWMSLWCEADAEAHAGSVEDLKTAAELPGQRLHDRHAQPPRGLPRRRDRAQPRPVVAHHQPHPPILAGPQLDLEGAAPLRPEHMLGRVDRGL